MRWILPILVTLALAASAYLFLRDDTAPKPEPKSDPKASTDGTLILPDDDADSDSNSRRSQRGTDRSPLSGDDAPDDAEAIIGPASAVLRGKRIVLIPADAKPPAGDPSRKTLIAKQSLVCAPTNSDASFEVQDAVLKALVKNLERSGAVVDRLDGESGSVSCVDSRVTRYEAGDFVIVLGGLDDPPLSASGVAVGKLSAAEKRRAERLASALSQALEIPLQSTTKDKATRDRLLEHGVIDRPGGAAVAWISLSGALPDTKPNQLAAKVASALDLTQRQENAAQSTESNKPRVRKSAPKQPQKKQPKLTQPSSPSDSEELGSTGPGSDT